METMLLMPLAAMPHRFENRCYPLSQPLGKHALAENSRSSRVVYGIAGIRPEFVPGILGILEFTSPEFMIHTPNCLK
jgi:hypothetical protein